MSYQQLAQAVDNLVASNTDLADQARQAISETNTARDAAQTAATAAEAAAEAANTNLDGYKEVLRVSGGTNIGSALPLKGSVIRMLEAKLLELPSVKDFGAIGDGTYRPVSDWYTVGATYYRGYANLAAVQVDYPHVKSADDSIDWAGIQATLDAYKGNAIHMPIGMYLITDTLYLSPASTVIGCGTGDSWGVTSTYKGTTIKCWGPGVKRIWTDVGLPDTPAGVLVDDPTALMVCLSGSNCLLSNLAVEGGSAADGSDAWDYGIINPSVRRTLLDRVVTQGTFKQTGMLIDATWSNTNTALQNIHKNVYGREVPSDQGSNEFTHQNCWFRGGNWGVREKGTDRTDTSANIWSPGGVSDLSGFASRVDNTPLGTRPNFPEDSGGYYRDLHNDFQNRRHIACRIGSQSGYGAFLDRGRFEQFDGFYGETRPDRCVTSAVNKTVDAIGAISVAANFGGEWLNNSPVTMRVYLTDTARIDVLAQKIRIGATWTTPTGSFVLRGVGFDATAGRVYMMADSITGSVTPSQEVSQAAGQTDANGGFYSTDRSGAVQTSGQSSFRSVQGLNAYFSATTHVRYLRAAGLQSTSSTLITTSSSEVSINCDTSQLNFYINRYGFVPASPQYRLRWLGTSLDSYSQADLGSVTRLWGTVRAASGQISVSDARMKTPVRGFEENEILASIDMVKEVGFFKFISSVAEKEPKGLEARDHCGMTVQKAIEILERHGLDPFKYSFICHDAWDDQYEDVDGKSVKVADAGDMFSFRVSGLIQFMLKGMDARLSALESK